jgi:hypothetical protein
MSDTHHIFPNYLMKGTMFAKSSLNITLCFDFLHNFWLNYFSFYVELIEVDLLSVINVRGYSCKVPDIFIRFQLDFNILGITRWRSWLRHCATSRKVANLIPDGVVGIFR